MPKRMFPVLGQNATIMEEEKGSIMTTGGFVVIAFLSGIILMMKIAESVVDEMIEKQESRKENGNESEAGK